MTDILEYLRGNAYPGRGILIGSDRVYYFIMGRSRNSRNRVFEATPDGVRTKAFDEKDVENNEAYHALEQKIAEEQKFLSIRLYRP